MPRVGLLAAAHPDLVAVVDAGRSRRRELEQRGQCQPGPILPGEMAEARFVVAGEEIVVDMRRFHGVPGQQAHPTVEEGRGVGLLSAEVVDAQLPEGVVHSGVETIALQPSGGVPHHLGEQVTVRLGPLANPAEVLPEVVIDVAGHVHPPAVDVELPQPVGGHVEEVAACLAVAQVDPRHGGHPVPRLIRGLHQRSRVVGFLDEDAGRIGEAAYQLQVGLRIGQLPVHQAGPVYHADGELPNGEPVPIGRTGSLLDDIGKGEEPGVAVVERSVQDHPHIAPVQLLHHPA